MQLKCVVREIRDLTSKVTKQAFKIARVVTEGLTFDVFLGKKEVSVGQGVTILIHLESEKGKLAARPELVG